MSVRSKALKRKAAEEGALKAKRAKGETDLCDNLKWSQEGEVMRGVCPLMKLTSDTLPGSKKIIGFDIDFTVIKTASGRTFATGASDWEWWDDCVPQKIRDCHNDGYRIVFFTNQAGIEKLKVTPQEFMKKAEAIVGEIGIPVLVFACTGTNHFRKPSTMMWEHFVQKCNGGVKPDLSQCRYVGDAAGRAAEWAPGKKKDFSCSDRMFAANIGINFQTPEEFFLEEKAVPFQWRSFNPNDVISTDKKAKKIDYHSNKQEVVVMTGCPASGKTTFRRKHLEPHGYVAINRDTLGTKAKCLKAAKTALDSGNSIVADNTNPSCEARSDYIALAKSKKIPCRCFWMKTQREMAEHLNFVRQNQTDGKVRRIPDVGYNLFYKQFTPPTKAEGFSEITEIDFVTDFESKRDETLFRQWTTGGH
ncbi:bifunctional polynucleotide phosphatase/kinase-like [Ylistrum balloti]|uniref:bifunctional polynucleotide phosphatase/kinase-like n=1 Tax=Ylistrum balloti TaxID=509963 RepID=UPI002905AC56|nr:bifunctional polynucleotide phosphatase/kinase-like [Ylistrum balloti]